MGLITRLSAARLGALLVATACSSSPQERVVDEALIESHALFPSTECDAMVSMLCVIRPSPDHMVSVSEVRLAPHGSFTRVEFKDQNVAGSNILIVNDSVSGDLPNKCDELDASLCPQVVYSGNLKARLFQYKGSKGLEGPSIRIDVIQTDGKTSPETLAKATIFFCYHVGGASALWCGDQLPICKVSPKGWCDVAFKEPERRR